MPTSSPLKHVLNKPALMQTIMDTVSPEIILNPDVRRIPRLHRPGVGTKTGQRRVYGFQR